MEPTTILFALLGAVGLVGADAYYNSSTIHLETSVAPVYEAKGFSHSVVESIFAGELDNIANTGSIAGELQFVTSNDKPVSSALAEAAGLSGAFEAAKSTLGIKHTTLLASIVVDTKEGKDNPRIVITGNTNDIHHFSLTFPLTTETPIDTALSEAAFLTMKEINPYIATLFAFEKAEANNVHRAEASRMVVEWLEEAPTSPYSPQRALFENLRGLLYLIDNDPGSADKWFMKAHKSDPEFAPAVLNLAFIALYRGDFDSAIKLAEPLSEVPVWSVSEDDTLTYVANVALGVALAGQEKFEEADAHFEKATLIRPNGVSGYFYWARSLLKQQRSVESEAMLDIAQRNVARINNYPELASLYFWLPPEPNGSLQRRTRNIPDVIAKSITP